MKRGIKNIFLSLLGFSAAPILTACYGIEPPEEVFDREFSGKVVDSKTGEAIEGIKVYAATSYIWDEITYSPIDTCDPAITNAEGHFSIYVGSVEFGAYFVAEDIDGEKNGHYLTVDEEITSFDDTIEMEEVTTEEDTSAKL